MAGFQVIMYGRFWVITEDEQAFRFNNREDMGDSERFVTVMRQIVGRRLTYKQLTGKTEEAGAIS
jgi:hypothetical protein